MQVFFWVHDEDEWAARMYDRAIILDRAVQLRPTNSLLRYDPQDSEQHLHAVDASMHAGLIWGA